MAARQEDSDQHGLLILFTKQHCSQRIVTRWFIKWLKGQRICFVSENIYSFLLYNHFSDCQGPPLVWCPGSLPGPGHWPGRDEHQGRAERGNQIPQQLPWVQPRRENSVVCSIIFFWLQITEFPSGWEEAWTSEASGAGCGLSQGRVRYPQCLIGCDPNTGLWLVK